MKQNVTCPYMDSGCCTRRGCIYLPHLDCLSHEEFKRRLEIAKKLSAKKKSKKTKTSVRKGKKQYEINNPKIKKIS